MKDMIPILYERGSRSPHGERGLKLWLHITYRYYNTSRSPHGERGLKYLWQRLYLWQCTGRSPHGERGLKSAIWKHNQLYTWSLSSRRAWIEIVTVALYNMIIMSLSSRRAWIEMAGVKVPIASAISVALLTESVD